MMFVPVGWFVVVDVEEVRMVLDGVGEVVHQVLLHELEKIVWICCL